MTHLNRRTALKSFAWITTGILALPAGSSLLSSCQNAADELLPNYTPVGFNPAQFKDITAIMNVILPDTDIAGAVKAGVPQFSDVFFKEIINEEEQLEFNTAYQAFADYMQKTFEKPFSEVPAEEQEAAFMAFAKSEGEWVDGEKRFWSSMKAMTIYGYTKTEVGATKALKHVSSPGRYDGCTTYTQGEGAWAE